MKGVIVTKEAVSTDKGYFLLAFCVIFLKSLWFCNERGVRYKHNSCTANISYCRSVDMDTGFFVADFGIYFFRKTTGS